LRILFVKGLFESLQEAFGMLFEVLVELNTENVISSLIENLCIRLRELIKLPQEFYKIS
jgi:hypothetical protein